MATMALSPYINYQHREGECQNILAETLADNGIPLDRVLLYPPMDNALMRQIYLGTDIGLFPNRCEGGNNMVMCEYMSCSRTVIASGMTGHADVISVNNAFPLMRCAPLYYKHSAEGVWFEAEVDEMVELLEQAYQNRRELRAKGLKAVTDMSRLSWKESARRFHALGLALSRQ
jgi:glycosyltransferase involved in cell wall biosynthesis